MAKNRKCIKRNDAVQLHASPALSILLFRPVRRSYIGRFFHNNRWHWKSTIQKITKGHNDRRTTLCAERKRNRSSNFLLRHSCKLYRIAKVHLWQVRELICLGKSTSSNGFSTGTSIWILIAITAHEKYLSTRKVYRSFCCGKKRKRRNDSNEA